MDFQSEFREYLHYCAKQKHLDPKTVKAYRIDIRQYLNFIENDHADMTRKSIDDYLSYLNQTYIRENGPWTLVKKYALTEKEAENNTDLIFKKYATVANN